jgi:hypothetical protein
MQTPGRGIGFPQQGEQRTVPSSWEIAMIQLGLHTDNWRALSGSFQAVCDAAVKYDLKHIEFAVIHGQYFTSVSAST